MKILSFPWVQRAPVLAALCAGVLWSATAAAQPETGTLNSRFLLIFDTSSTMKSRIPATKYAVQRLFLAVMNGQLHSQDELGVWAFDRELRAGEVPLQSWLPQNAATITSNINSFVEQQHYAKSTRFDAIMPAVNKLVQNSERLTVLIFCDGAGQITGTPYDDAINSGFRQNESALAKTKAVFVVVLRSQHGHYTGYSVNSSDVGVNFPQFPPLPVPPQPVAAPQSAPPPPVPTPAARPVATLPPLVIVGTNVSTNLLPPSSGKGTIPNPPPARVESSSPPPKPLPGSTHAAPTNAAPSKIAGTSTNAVGAENSGLSREGALKTGAILLSVAALLILLGLIRSRSHRGSSLITRSMNKK